MRKLVDFFEAILPGFPDASAVNFGGGIPHPYRPDQPAYDLSWYRPVLEDAVVRLARAAGRPIRVEIEPGRYAVAGMAALVCGFTTSRPHARMPRALATRFVMVDAGFCDLVRPAMYGAYHHISVVGAGANRTPEPLVVAGPFVRKRRRLHARRKRANWCHVYCRGLSRAIFLCCTTLVPTARP